MKAFAVNKWAHKGMILGALYLSGLIATQSIDISYTPLRQMIKKALE